ncbi:protein adenylyltransferase SelO [Alkalihalobacillus trypoxylicola]|uniref:Protein nucleotidyltransferase YdiU n=1 Tax=Alkalihalobacillus trypoxylicola TaxID=519424 RepID=A0A162F030_9BACI|nr:YdiU family protein [Alkalihalobacillus trypoxylicola]KYG34144.1 hypothetical protein AZF04_15055 [Alkalihalobacillus trypoxylicola]
MSQSFDNDFGWNLEKSYHTLPEIFYKIEQLDNTSDPKIVVFNKQLGEQLGLNSEAFHTESGAQVLSGSKTPNGGMSISLAYAGHQFGHFTMLGDGRALLIGEQISPQKERYDIHLKGSGPTHFSRGGDGRAALAPMLREYLISEAMFALGIPTTRSLAVTSTGNPVYRETVLPGATLTRVASSHIRVGTFQYARQYGSIDDLRALADYTITRHFTSLIEHENRYLGLLQTVMKQQASLIAKWQLVGFVHGVMNTDNMTISGETIDYGPCAFMNEYNQATVFSSIDHQGRYAYGNQPYMAAWNLARLAESILPLLNENQDEALKTAEGAIGQFQTYYDSFWYSGMSKKLGLFQSNSDEMELSEALLKLMEKNDLDFTNTFIDLTFEKCNDSEVYQFDEFKQWKKQWEHLLKQQSQSKEESISLMKENNPAAIPRNHLVEEALEEAVEQENYQKWNELLKVVTNPFEHNFYEEKYTAPPNKSATPYKTFCGT